MDGPRIKSGVSPRSAISPVASPRTARTLSSVADQGFEKDPNQRPNVDLAMDKLPVIAAKIQAGTANEEDFAQASMLIQLADAELTKDEHNMQELQTDLGTQKQRLRDKRKEKPKVTTRKTINAGDSKQEKEAFRHLKQEKEKWYSEYHKAHAKNMDLENTLKVMKKQNDDVNKALKAALKDKSSAVQAKDAAEKLSKSKFSKADLKKLKQLEELQQKLQKEKAKLKIEKDRLKKDNQSMDRERENLQKERNKHHHDVHEFEKKLKRMKADQEKLAQAKHRMKLDEDRMKHEHIQMDQRKLKLDHNMDLHKSHDSQMHKLRRDLYEAENKLKWALMRLKWQGKQTTKIVERLRFVPHYIEDNGWDRSQVETYINDFVLGIETEDSKHESQIKKDEKIKEGQSKDKNNLGAGVGGGSGSGDAAAELLEQKRLNSQLHDELERVHTEFVAFRKGLTTNLETLNHNEDNLVDTAHDMMEAFDHATIHAIMERSPNMRPKQVADMSSKQVTQLIGKIQHLIEDAHEHEHQVESEDHSNVLTQVGLKDSVKIVLSESLIRIGRLILAINKMAMARQIGDGNITDPTAGMTIASNDEGEYAVKYARLQKKYEELRVHEAQHKNVIELLRKQLKEAYMRHAQIHKELEGVLKIFLKAQMAGEDDTGKGYQTRIDVGEELTKDPDITRHAVADALGVSEKNVFVNTRAQILEDPVEPLYEPEPIIPAGTRFTPSGQVIGPAGAKLEGTTDVATTTTRTYTETLETIEEVEPVSG